MEECCNVIINEYTAYRQVVNNYSSSKEFTTEDFAACETRFKDDAPAEYQRGGAKFALLLVQLGKPKEKTQVGGTARFSWLDVDGTDHRIIKAYSQTVIGALTNRVLVSNESALKPWMDTGEGNINIPLGVACVVTKQDLFEAKWDQARAVLTGC